MSRVIPPWTGDERTLLASFLDWYRGTAAVKCEGLSEEDAHRVLLPSSPMMSIAGLVNHLRWVEYHWFEHRLLGRADLAPWSDEDPDAEFRVDGRTLADLLAEYDKQCEASRQAIADLPLDTLTEVEVDGAHISLRWILHHMIEETARHAGHLDILRELVDGTRGQ